MRQKLDFWTGVRERAAVEVVRRGLLTSKFDFFLKAFLYFQKLSKINNFWNLNNFWKYKNAFKKKSNFEVSRALLTTSTL
jgi:hypothetical protein